MAPKILARTAARIETARLPRAETNGEPSSNFQQRALLDKPAEAPKKSIVAARATFEQAAHPRGA